MSIHFISGKPGGGKSLYAVKKIIDELVLTNRTIITNLALNLPELSAYLQKTYPKKIMDLHQRIRQLEDDQCREFYLYRSRKKPMDGEPYGDWYKCDPPDKEGRINFKEAVELESVLYVIDEAHLFWNARQWQATGPAVMFYNSQHRKLGDDVILISQHVMNVDKQMRSLVQDYTYVRNHRKEKFAMIFRSLPFLTRSVYSEPYTGTQTAQEQVPFRLDVKGVCQCYYTAAGVGIMGKEADTKEPRRGLPMTVLIACFVAIGALAFYVPDMIGKGLSSALSFETKKTVSSPGVKQDLTTTLQNVLQGSHKPEEPKKEEAKSEEIVVVAQWNLGNGPVVTLSDGSRWTVQDGVQETNRKGVRILGTNYAYQTKINPTVGTNGISGTNRIYRYKDLTNGTYVIRGI